MEIEPIAHIRTEFPQKFGIPRQSGLAKGLLGRIVFEPQFRRAEAVRGLEGFDYIWLLWGFSANRRVKENRGEISSEDIRGGAATAVNVTNRAAGKTAAGGDAADCAAGKAIIGNADAAVEKAVAGYAAANGAAGGAADDEKANGNAASGSTDKMHWTTTVRPPRLGGNAALGVFATRSPYRPNPIGLSSLKLERIDLDCPDAPVLWVRGADLMDGTPIYDIKPYLTYTDAHPAARCGYVDSLEDRRLEVVFTAGIPPLSPDFRQRLGEILALDPRPRYQEDPKRIYGLSFEDHNVRFKVEGNKAIVTEVSQD